MYYPTRMIDFVAFMRSRGWTRRAAHRLWGVYSAKGRLTPSDLRFAMCEDSEAREKTKLVIWK